jgi:hypothetical protein
MGPGVLSLIRPVAVHTSSDLAIKLELILSPPAVSGGRISFPLSFYSYITLITGLSGGEVFNACKYSYLVRSPEVGPQLLFWLCSGFVLVLGQTCPRTKGVVFFILVFGGRVCSVAALEVVINAHNIRSGVIFVVKCLSWP